MENPIYLGDEAYATADPDGFVLTTGTYIQEEAGNIVYLGPAEAQTLVNWLGGWGIKCK